MEKTFTDSKTISGLRYSETTKILIITFTTGKEYAYANVPLSVVEEALKAESIGSYVAKNIRNSYEYKLLN